MRPDTSSAIIAGMDGRFPLPTLLSQTLVAFTIEFDNEAEHRMPHRTTKHGYTPGSFYAPWLVSLAMWANCMQFLGEEAVPVHELVRRARTTTNFAGMQRWGYIFVGPDVRDRRPKPPRSSWVVRATPAGRKAQEIWRPLLGVIEKRWEERFGKKEIQQLRESLWAVGGKMDVELPDCMPILGYGLFSKDRIYEGRDLDQSVDTDSPLLPLPALLARVLLAFAIDFEGESDLSLAICANVLRVLDEEGARVRDLPVLAGVSKEAISMAFGILRKRHLAVVEADSSGSRVKVAKLTVNGRKARDDYRRLLGDIEKRWEARFGKDSLRALRESLEPLVGEGTAGRSPLFRGLEPYPDGWRASVRKPETLPHFPMVLHRGGFPDGS
ncbi:MAG: MarR family winged helix-turn-helix transcriptional regulator [Candidatus Acidiferrum sp.]